MEELQAALKGNSSEIIENTHVCVPNPLTDETEEGKSSDSTGNIESTINLIDSSYDQDGSSVNVETHTQTHLLKTHSQDYIDTWGTSDEDTAMAEYLNSRRHSHSTTREFISHDSLLDDGNSDEKHSSDQYLTRSYCPQSSQSKEAEMYVDDDSEPINIRKDSFFLLSPIEENSEKADSAENESIYGSCNSGNRSIETKSPKSPRLFSHSWDHLPERKNSFKECDEQYQTLPRAKIPVAHTNRDIWDSFRFPTEPRELDPAAYHQLHTADSQEELQEFLLLESECMTDGKSNGLASAFTMSDEGPRIFLSEEINDDRGTMSGS